MEMNHELIQLVGCIMIFGMPIAIVFIVMYFSYHTKKSKYQLAEKMAECGQQLPESMFSEQKKRSPAIKSLQTGLIFMAVGIGAIIMFSEIGLQSPIGLGFIPLFIGVAYLIIYIITRKEKNKEATQNADAKEIDCEE